MNWGFKIGHGLLHVHCQPLGFVGVGVGRCGEGWSMKPRGVAQMNSGFKIEHQGCCTLTASLWAW